MKCQLGKLMNLPSEVETLQRQIDHLKVNQKPEVNENVPQKPKFPYLEKARSRLPSTASNTSKRARTEDETENDFVEVKPKSKPRKPLNFGTKSNDTPFLGAEPRPKRKHLYVGRLSPDCTENDVISWCSKNGAKIQHIRKVSKPDSKLQSFHLVFDPETTDDIESDDFWPQNVVHNRYHLNSEAREWLKNQSKTDQ